MTERESLIEAQMHLECLNEAWLEFLECFRDISPERKEVVREEISSRIWAAIYLIQYRNKPEELASEKVSGAIREANSFNGGDDEVDTSGLH